MKSEYVRTIKIPLAFSQLEFQAVSHNLECAYQFVVMHYEYTLLCTLQHNDNIIIHINTTDWRTYIRNIEILKVAIY